MTLLTSRAVVPPLRCLYQKPHEVHHEAPSPVTDITWKRHPPSIKVPAEPDGLVAYSRANPKNDRLEEDDYGLVQDDRYHALRTSWILANIEKEVKWFGQRVVIEVFDATGGRVYAEHVSYFNAVQRLDLSHDWKESVYLVMVRVEGQAPKVARVVVER